MAKVFEKSLFFRMGVGFMSRSIRLGLAPKGAHLLSVEDPESGALRSTPVTVIENEGSRWLVAPYGETRWVRNARAAGWVRLQRGRRTERLQIAEVGAEEGAPVLREYVQQVSMVRPYFDVDADAPAEDFRAEVPRHPVFRVVGPTP
jgi:F420H(2)-dependent quinone reductase